MNKKAEKTTASIPNKNSLLIDPKAISLILGIIVVILALVSIAGQYLKYYSENESLADLIKIVDIGTELTIPSIFSTYLLFLAALLLAAIAYLKRKEKAKHFFAWLFLTLGFLFMVFDEGASIHELTMYPISKAIGNSASGIFLYSWVIPAIVLIVIIFVILFKFLRDLPSKTRWGFFIAGAVYLFGAIGFELIAGNYASQFGMDNFLINIFATIEEVLEMAGIILFINQLLLYIKQYYPDLQIAFNQPK